MDMMDFELTSHQDIIITMLPKGPHVLDAFTNAEKGLLTATSSARRKLFIECSTIDVKTSLQVGAAVSVSGLGDFVDSPVSGGPNGANAGTLTFMIGGSEELFSKVKPIVMMMGKEESIFHCGELGAGLATKQLNNYLSAVSMIGLCEAMNTGVRYGLDPKVLSSVINVSTGRCYNSIEQNPIKGISPKGAASNDFEGGFSIEMCTGVVEMAAQLSKDVGAKNILSDLVVDTLQKGTQHPRTKGKDYRSIYRLFAEDEGNALE